MRRENGTKLESLTFDPNLLLVPTRVHQVCIGICFLVVSLYDRLYFSSYASHKQPVKDNEVAVSDWLPMSRCGMRKFHSGHLPAMNL